MTTSHWFAILATVLSAGFFVASKVLLSRGLPWQDLWAWSLTTTGAIGLVAWLACGMPAVPWTWCLAAGMAGVAAHVAANQAMSWGDATLLVPISGAKPLALLALVPLISGARLPPGLVHACWLATFGIALVGLAPRRVHRHAPHPGLAFLLMTLAMVLMALSDVCGGEALKVAGPAGMIGTIAVWNLTMGIVPVVAMVGWRRPPSLARALPAIGVGALFALFIAAIAAAFALADPERGVAEVNVVVACRGVVGILMVLALDRWLATSLEPLPRWVHGVRLAGAAILAVAVGLAYA